MTTAQQMSSALKVCPLWPAWNKAIKGCGCEWVRERFRTSGSYVFWNYHQRDIKDFGRKTLEVFPLPHPLPLETDPTWCKIPWTKSDRGVCVCVCVCACRCLCVCACAHSRTCVHTHTSMYSVPVICSAICNMLIYTLGTFSRSRQMLVEEM